MSEKFTLSTPFDIHGKLRVDGVNLVDKNNKPYKLFGFSTHGLAWFPQYVNKETFKALCDDYNTNCIRLVLYPHEYGGYCTNGDKKALFELIQKGIDIASDLGMYVIVDWHVLNEKSPGVYEKEAADFFAAIATHNSTNDNILYEICNEPNSGVSWEEICDYSKNIISIIREKNKAAIILVGTPNWSQEIDKALLNPLDFDNLMYTMHFYADTHTQWLRDRTKYCIENGLPVFISEFNICNSLGMGINNTKEGELWFDLINKYNLSYICWSLSNSPHTSSALTFLNDKLSNWEMSDFSESGQWVINKFLDEKNR